MKLSEGMAKVLTLHDHGDSAEAYHLLQNLEGPTSIEDAPLEVTRYLLLAWSQAEAAGQTGQALMVAQSLTRLVRGLARVVGDWTERVIEAEECGGAIDTEPVRCLLADLVQAIGRAYPGLAISRPLPVPPLVREPATAPSPPPPPADQGSTGRVVLFAPRRRGATGGEMPSSTPA